MKKITTISLISALTCTSFAHAGAMGEAETPLCLSTFVALEGGYSSNTINGNEVIFGPTGVGFEPFKSNSGASGRVSIGVANKIEELAVSGEMGWGYYGQTTFRNESAFGIFNLSNQYTLTGFDVLAGIGYAQPSFSLFFKAGAMVENMSTKFAARINNPILSPNAGVSVEDNKTEVLPLLKAGGSYNFNENWAITAAYQYAIGSTVRNVVTLEPFALADSENINLRNSSIGTVLVGLQFSI